MILIKHKGELQLVESLKGYPRAKVIAKDVAPPPNHHCRWENGGWKEDVAAKDEAKQQRKLNAMTRTELVDHLMKMLNNKAGSD